MIAYGLLASIAVAVSSPPPEIARTHSAAFCTELRQRIEPAAELVSENDREYLGVKNVYDVTTRMGKVRDAYLVGGTVANFEAIDKLLEPTPPPGTTQDERQERRLRQALRDARATQNEMLNILNGKSETSTLNQMLAGTLNFATPVEQPYWTRFTLTHTPITSRLPVLTPDELTEAAFGYSPKTLALNRRLARDRKALHDQFESTVLPTISKLLADCR